jgi:hypothetical protein
MTCSRSARYSVPPRGIASRAFRARFRIAVSSSPGSTNTLGDSGSQSTLTLIGSPSVRARIGQSSLSSLRGSID